MNPDTTLAVTENCPKDGVHLYQCGPDPVVVEQGDEIVVDTYACPSGVEVVLCKVKNQEHYIRRDLRDRADSIAIEFLLKHKGK
ncbi:MAG: hypothetical protein JRE45_20715 [Deltaproteobacteria bacterium]|nr:hypothetical protein [Deltaproteobacteria bacterium]